jgi:lysophospholipase L1-like esterase
MTSRRSTLGPAFALAAGAVVVMLVLSEIALRIVAPIPDPYSELERLRPQVNQYIRFEYPRHYSAVTEAEPGLSGLSGQNRFTTNNFGFRGDSLPDPKPPEEFRIFMVGGSTTECFYLDDDDDLARVMQRALSERAPAGKVVRVYNAGLSGAASDDHVAMISQRIVHLEPDLVVVFCGINDLSRSIYRHDYRHYIPYRPAYSKPWYKALLVKFQVGRRLYSLAQNIRYGRRQVQEQRTLKTNYAGLIGMRRTVPESNFAPPADTLSYANNLRSIAGMARANRFSLVFMTQQTTWNSDVDAKAKDFHWMRYRENAPGSEPGAPGVTFREDLIDAAMERLNDTMRRVAAENSVPMYDLARLLPQSLRYFYDDCHFNVAGADTTANELATFLVTNQLVR